LLSAIFHVFGVVTALVVGIAAISLVVAGIGIMNIMLITVTERTREIGVRMAVGARRSDIFRQFLAEAIALSVVGGSAGVVVAVAAGRAIAHFTLLRPVATPGVVTLALGVCIVMGITFGTVPAARASGLSPVEALRHE
jgi:putative ABC transport system permease protein